MKKNIITLIVSVLVWASSWSQAPNASCFTSENVCANNGSTFPLWSGASPNPVVPSAGSSPSNPSSNPQGVNSGCLLAGELNPNWFVITAGSNGQLVFTIGNAGGSGFMDWALWSYDPSNPNSACNAIASGASGAPVACNWNGSSAGFTGMYPGTPPGGTASNFQPPLNVTAGQSFVLMFSNYSSQTGNATLSFPPTPGAASIACSASTPDQTICLGSPATVNIVVSTGNNTITGYSWTPTTGVSNPTGGQNVSVNPPTTTTYVVDISLNNGGVISDTFTINVVNPPTPNAGLDDSVCLGTPINLVGTLSNPAQNTGSWSFNAAGIVPAPTVNFAPNFNSMTPTVTVNQPGLYSFILRETSTVCGIVRDTARVTVVQHTQTTSFVAPTCPGASDGSITINSANAVQYSFDNGATWQASNTATGFASGIHNVCSQDYMGCQACSQVNIPVAPTPVISAGNDQLICENGTATFWASVTNITNPIFHWSHDPANTAANATDNPTVSPTVYTVYAEAANGCLSDTATITVTIRPPLSGQISLYDTICPTYPTTIGVGGLSGGLGAPYNIVWNTGQTAAGTIDSMTVVPANTTIYSVTITDNCESTPLVLETQVYVAPVPEPAIVVTQPNICEDAVFEISNATDPAMSAQLEWNLPYNLTITNQSVVYTDPLKAGVYDVQLIVTSPQGCIDSTTFQGVLTSEPKPVANFSWSPNPVLMFNTDVTFSNNSWNAAYYQWFMDGGNPSYSELERPSTVYPDGVEGQYPVTLLAISEFGCADTLTKPVIVLPEVLIYAPNAFTPDGDEFNQTWNVTMEGVDIQSFNLKIYNRWGEIIWESNDMTVGWDGTYNGRPVEQGTYVWTIQARDQNNDGKYNWNGHLTLLR